MRVFIHDMNVDLLTKADTLRNEAKIGQAKKGYEKIIEGREYNTDVTNYAAFLVSKRLDTSSFGLNYRDGVNAN